MAPSTPIEIFDPPNLVDSRPSYSHIASVGSSARLVYIAGQVGTHIDGKTPKSFEDQAQLAFANLRHCLDAAGASVRNIAKLTFYIVDWAKNHKEFGGPLMEFLTDSEGVHRPPSTLISVPALAHPEWLVEVEAVAAVQDPAPPISKLLTSNVVDVVVVGAGLSGLQAALDVQKAGLNCVVLEARDRVGGKTLSHPLVSGKGVVDLGAAWLNEKTQPKIYALAKKYGFETVIQPMKGDNILQDSSGRSQRVAEDQHPDLPAATLEAVGMLTGILETEAAKLDLRNLPISKFDKITVDEFLRQQNANEDAYKFIETTVKGLLGVDATELSLFFYLDYIKSGGSLEDLSSEKSSGAQYQRLRQGMQSISKGMADDLNSGSLFLESPVSSIHQENDSLSTVTTQNGKVFRAKKVIISIPTPLYRTINFSPSLPEAKSTLADSTTLGYYAKTILIYNKPWWRDIGLNASFISFTGTVSFSLDTSVEADGQYSITCFIIGGTGRKWSILSPIKRRQAILDHITSMIGEEHGHKVYQTEEVIEQEWIKEHWSQGAPSPVMLPGLLTKYGDVLRAPCGNLHFVGTETAYEWKGYMDGAIRAGERGANEVIQDLKKSAGSRL